MTAFESGIRLELIEEYLRRELGLKNIDDSTFGYRDCFIRVTPLEDRKLGLFGLPRTRLSVWGNAMDAEDFRHKFLMRFLGSGG